MRTCAKTHTPLRQRFVRCCRAIYVAARGIRTSCARCCWPPSVCVRSRAMSETELRYLNRPARRTEDYRLLTGHGRYVDDIEIGGALHACFVRSPHAHARIVSIDASEALAIPGVIAVVTGRDLAQWTRPMRVAPPIEGLCPVEIETLPIDVVRFHVDPVAC